MNGNRQVFVVPTRTGAPSAIWLPAASDRTTSPPPMLVGSSRWPADGRKVISRYLAAFTVSTPSEVPAAKSAVAPTTVKLLVVLQSGGSWPAFATCSHSLRVTVTAPTAKLPVSR